MFLFGIQPIFMLFFSLSLIVYKYVTAVSMQTCCLMELYQALIYIHAPTKQFINRINKHLANTYFTSINSQLKG